MRGRPAPWRRLKGLRVAPGAIVTPFKAEVLRQLARAGDRGSCACYGIMPGATLASLSMFGLAEHAPDIDDLGGRRYRITARGRDVLQQLEASHV